MRELEVLRALAKGWSNKRIAAQLQISEGTVKIHVSNILGKLEASSRTDAVRMAYQARLL
jgi:DNA-binding NarL/FixJ family response regulator